MADKVFYVALKGGQYKVGALTTQTSTGNFSTTGVGFQPTAGMFFSFMNAAATGITNSMAYSAGFATASDARAVQGALSQEGDDVTDADEFFDATALYQSYDFAQALTGEIDFVSWDSDGFTLNQTDADASGLQVIYIVMGSDAVTPNRISNTTQFFQLMGIGT